MHVGCTTNILKYRSQCLRVTNGELVSVSSYGFFGYRIVIWVMTQVWFTSQTLTSHLGYKLMLVEFCYVSLHNIILYAGEYLGLTGARLDGAEMLACGLATHFMPSVVSLVFTSMRYSSVILILLLILSIIFVSKVSKSWFRRDCRCLKRNYAGQF